MTNVSTTPHNGQNENNPSVEWDNFKRRVWLIYNVSTGKIFKKTFKDSAERSNQYLSAKRTPQSEWLTKLGWLS